MKSMYNFLTSKALIASVVISFTIASCQETSVENQSSAPSAPTGSVLRVSGESEFVEGELLIQFKEGASAAAKQKAFDKVKGQPVEKILTKAMERAGRKEGLALVKVNKNVLEAVAELNGAEGVEFAEPNYLYQHTAMSTDTYFTNGSLWGMYGPSTSPASPYGSNAAAAWAAGNTGSATVYVGVIDEGIQLTHQDLAGQVWVNPADPTDGIDNDGNGLVDDTNGWDFANKDGSIYDGGTKGTLDDHGTHVSGTIGGKANGQGVVGVNWDIKLISAKFLGRRGGTTADAVKAVDYLTSLKNRGINIVASNNSWGGGGYSQALFDAIARANNAGIMFIAAAGNSGTNNDVTASYPSNYNLPNVIAVAAIDKNGALASFSQYGATTVDIGAPGVAINSTTAYNTYSSYNGTSMATPHVTGAVALYASTHPGASVAQIRNAILSSAVPTASLAGKTVTGGRLDVNAALSK
ncbi:subtilisin family serine protease [Dyadobacter sp. BE34]|uniref:Subtilisin family serine protease n=1 Tax=Dyadobacter fermentans TaxID=94254 RepID=A0ABU1QQ41_9BACT|nr:MULTISPECIES: S8 family peptidase [Dyadobacter]MDR6803227.1 subtilisin family serine protease [Dyadobacter fermentans]MDR7040968.1 subtilisin family serine protease [Dyadobacter sp. BE242]MDR7195371.1 subtilisin family serine protease [Dyadobacter sp. BE34]MDR7214084.1 subtilisin family serine protease [Dyadobacter sp. BE31]MDR7260778.1 subtilisin family serine protease [Dyadobacter sp. BE32]